MLNILADWCKTKSIIWCFGERLSDQKATAPLLVDFIKHIQNYFIVKLYWIDPMQTIYVLLNRKNREVFIIFFFRKCTEKNYEFYIFTLTKVNFNIVDLVEKSNADTQKGYKGVPR